MKTVQTIYRFSHTERLFFASKPPLAVRRQLSAAGWKWDRRGAWFRNHNLTEAIKPKQLESLLTPAEQPETATA